MALKQTIQRLAPYAATAVIASSATLGTIGIVQHRGQKKVQEIVHAGNSIVGNKILAPGHLLSPEEEQTLANIKLNHALIQDMLGDIGSLEGVTDFVPFDDNAQNELEEAYIRLDGAKTLNDLKQAEQLLRTAREKIKLRLSNQFVDISKKLREGVHTVTQDEITHIQSYLRSVAEKAKTLHVGDMEAHLAYMDPALDEDIESFLAETDSDKAKVLCQQILYKLENKIGDNSSLGALAYHHLAQISELVGREPTLDDLLEVLKIGGITLGIGLTLALILFSVKKMEFYGGKAVGAGKVAIEHGPKVGRTVSNFIRKRWPWNKKKTAIQPPPLPPNNP